MTRRISIQSPTWVAAILMTPSMDPPAWINSHQIKPTSTDFEPFVRFSHLAIPTWPNRIPGALNTPINPSLHPITSFTQTTILSNPNNGDIGTVELVRSQFCCVTTVALIKAHNSCLLLGDCTCIDCSGSWFRWKRGEELVAQQDFLIMSSKVNGHF